MPDYEKLLRNWERDTAVRSDPATDHPAYAELLAAGELAVPTLLRALHEHRGWKAITALRGIFGEEGPDVQDVSGQIEPIRQRWLAWAEERRMPMVTHQELVQASLEYLRASDRLRELLSHVDDKTAHQARVEALSQRVEELRSDAG